MPFLSVINVYKYLNTGKHTTEGIREKLKKLVRNGEKKDNHTSIRTQLCGDEKMLRSCWLTSIHQNIWSTKENIENNTKNILGEKDESGK